ncbi:hypothetical protein V7S43_005554 [Phytophthora oleae]|uniref:Vesicle tethering protein Uso1/P115-like head domain-containing protein n=1 Tax=Phytophthora oleae TaxID=2107226 RepID=A0ABD3FTZ7_9STRA
MYGAPIDDRVRLQESLQRLQHEKGEADGMLSIMKSKLQEAEEDNFDLRSSMAMFEAETKYESDKKEREMKKQLAAFESKLALMSQKMMNAERAKLRAIKEVEELQQKSVIEGKRRDAERRLMATKRRKAAASQSILMSQLSQSQQSQQSQVARPPPISVVETAVQTEMKIQEENSGDLKEENAKLVSYLLTGTSRDLLTLLNGTVAVDPEDDAMPNLDADRTQPPQGCQSSTPSQFGLGSSSNSTSDSMPQSGSGVPFSQSVFSQLAGRASAQAHASLVSVARETNVAQNALATERARELYDALGKMLAGDASAVALAPVLVKNLAAPTDLEWAVICSVLRVMYSVAHHSTHFQRFLLVSSPSEEPSSQTTGIQRNLDNMAHPRISLPGLRFTSLDDYLSACSDYDSVVQSDLQQLSAIEAASEQRHLRLKLMGALCRVIKNNFKEPAVVKDGLHVLSFWVDLGLTHRPVKSADFKPLLASNVIPAILLAPKGVPTIKAQALRLLSQLLRVPEVFTAVEMESKKSLLFNRCAKMLIHEGGLSWDEAKQLRTLQHEIVKLLLSIATSFPSEGIRFVLESTHGLPSDSDGYRSVIYYLSQLLHQETFDARTASTGGESCVLRELLNDQFRTDLIQDSFSLLGLLSRYVDLRNELGGDDHVQSFFGVLYFLSNLTHDICDNGLRNDSIAASARAMVVMMNSSGQ